MAPVSSLGAVVSWEEDDTDGEARAVLGHSTSPTIDASLGVGMVGGVKQLLLICAVVALVGCSPTVEIADPIVEEAIRVWISKPEGKLTKADLDKVHTLILHHNQLTEPPKELEKLTQLEHLEFGDNQLTNVKGLEKLTKLRLLGLRYNQLTELPKGLEKLTQLEVLVLYDNPDLTKAQIAELQKALPNCEIESNPTK